MLLPQLLLSGAALISLAAADFHIVASNAANAQGQIVGDTDIFVIGSNDDTHDNKCSQLNTGKFSVSTVNVAHFDEDQGCTNGLCLLQGKSFSFTSPFCNLAGANFRKMNGTSYLFFDTDNTKIGRCLATPQTQESCIGVDSSGKKFLSGDIDDLFFCQVDGNPGFCDPMTN